jgi:hypothetical protein
LVFGVAQLSGSFAGFGFLVARIFVSGAAFWFRWLIGFGSGKSTLWVRQMVITAS